MASEKITVKTISTPVFGRNSLTDLSISFPLGIFLNNGQLAIIYREFVRDFPEEEIPSSPRDIWISTVGDSLPDASGIRLEESLSVPGSLFGQIGQIAIYCVECNPL